MGGGPLLAPTSRPYPRPHAARGPSIVRWAPDSPAGNAGRTPVSEPSRKRRGGSDASLLEYAILLAIVLFALVALVALTR
jgi:hypothetical protein